MFHRAQNVNGGYWFPDSGVTALDIDSTLFTHLFSFTSDVQQKNPSVVTLQSIGGGDSSANDFASMASQSSSRKTFIDSLIALARSKGFHGLDLDWEYPDTDAKMANLGLLLKEWWTAVAAEAASSGMDALLLAAAVYYLPHHQSNTNYPVVAMAESLDWINVMAYDFVGSRSTTTGPLAALYNPGRAGNLLKGDHG
ncbi:hypothetical protein NL676_036295 [Syzygium grande]|nr:hypothetical protein NL676_036295 [Syzygium grande]